jgi:peptide/nickel transport system substrate-binding protein
MFKQVWTSPYLLMVPTGFDPKHPVGTGPFKYVSATTGRASTFTRYAGYWGKKPKVKTLKVLDFPNRQAEIKALRGGQIDIAAQVPPQQADSLGRTPGIKVLESKSNFHLTIGMRTDIQPFNDKRVRQAVRLLVDRKEVVKNAYSGHGSVANDLFVRQGDCVPNVPQRKQNIAKAKRLLAEAGESHLTFSIATANDEPGMLATAQVIQQNAKKAGVTVHINKLDTAGFLAKWKQWSVAIGYGTEPYVFDIQESFLPGGGNNITHWDDKKFESLTHKLYTTADKAKRCQVKKQMHAVQYRAGGDLVPAWADVLTAHRDTVTGLVKTTYLSPVYYLTGVSVNG